MPEHLDPWSEEQLDRGVFVRYEGRGVTFSFVCMGGRDRIEEEKEQALNYLDGVDRALGVKL